jgi:hypothetical protein
MFINSKRFRAISIVGDQPARAYQESEEYTHDPYPYAEDFEWSNCGLGLFCIALE